MAKHVVDSEDMKNLGRALKVLLPEDVGFILLTYNYFDTHSRANYLSSANREDCIKFLRETADRLEEQRDFQTPNNTFFQFKNKWK